MKKPVALSSGASFLSIFPAVILKDRAELSIEKQTDSGFPRFEGYPEVLVEFASAAAMAYTVGSQSLNPGTYNEASRVLEFSTLVQFAAKLAKTNETTEISSSDLVALTEQVLQQASDREGAVGSNPNSPDKAQVSQSPVTPKAAKPDAAVASSEAEGATVAYASSNLDFGFVTLHEFQHGNVLKELSDKNHTELVISKTHPEKGRVLRGALELSKNLEDQAKYKVKKEQVPCTAVLLNVANFNNGIMDRRTYAVSADGNVGFGCCFIPDMKDVQWTPGKMRAKDIKGTIVYSNAFRLFNKLDKGPKLPFEATKSTLYGFEVLARLCAPELAGMKDKQEFWEQLEAHEEADLATAVRVMEPMFAKPAYYDGVSFKDGQVLPAPLTSTYSDGFQARSRATAHLRDLAVHHQNLSNKLMALAKKREAEEAQYEKETRMRALESVPLEELEELARKRRKLQQETENKDKKQDASAVG